MVKDEDLCVHCGLCAERCPTAAWDMQKSYVHWPHADDEARDARAAANPRSPERLRRREYPMPQTTPARVNDFAIKIATVNGTGSASANTLLMKSIFRSGIPVMGKNYFPSNIQGLPTWYEIRVTKRRLRRALRPRRHHGRDERRDLRAGRARKSPPAAIWFTTRPGRARRC